MFAVSATLFLYLVIYRENAQPFLDGLRLYHHQLYEIAVGVSGFMGVVFLGVTIQYLATSPEQNAKYILKAKAKLPPTLMDTGNRYYSVPTWKYIAERFGSG